jgi:hypothetical protein
MAGCRTSKQSGRGPAFEPDEWAGERGRPTSGQRTETKNNKRSTRGGACMAVESLRTLALSVGWLTHRLLLQPSALILISRPALAGALVWDLPAPECFVCGEQTRKSRSRGWKFQCSQREGAKPASNHVLAAHRGHALFRCRRPAAVSPTGAAPGPTRIPQHLGCADPELQGQRRD